MLPRCNIPIGVTDTGMRPGSENFKKYADLLGLLVQPSPLLVQNNAKFPMALFATKHFAPGALLTGMWGQYMSRLPRGQEKKLNYISVAQVPGA
jgi:hypothetical protein